MVVVLRCVGFAPVRFGFRGTSVLQQGGGAARSKAMPSPVGLSSRSSSRARSVPDRSPGSGNAAQLPSQCVTGMSTSRVSPFCLTLTYLQRLGASEGGGEGVVVTV